MQAMEWHTDIRMDMGSLQQVGMTLDLHRNKLTHLSLGPLRLVGADLLLQSNDALSLLDTGALTAIGGDLSVGFTALGLLDLGDVREIGGSLRACDNARVTTVDFGARDIRWRVRGAVKLRGPAHPARGEPDADWQRAYGHQHFAEGG